MLTGRLICSQALHRLPSTLRPRQPQLARRRLCLFSLLLTASTRAMATAASSSSSSATMRGITFAPGPPENMVLADMPRPTPRVGELLLEVTATGVNRADTLQRKGLYPPPPGESEILGLEAVGRVAALGPETRGRFQPGQRVAALLPGGGYAEYACVDERHVMAVPAALDDTTMAAVPEVWLTAFQLLHKVASVQAGHTVLVHACGSSVGVAAIQLARLAGAKVIATGGTEDKLQLARDLGAAAAFNYKSGPWDAAVMEATEGKGVDIILDPVGGSYWEMNSNVLAMDSTWVLYGLMGGPKVDGPLLRKLLSKRTALRASTLRTRSPDYKAELVADFEARIMPRIGDLRLVVDSTFPLAEAAAAHAKMESNANVGKIVLLVADAAKRDAADL